MRIARATRWLAVALPIAVAACGGGGDGTTEPPDTGDFTVTLSSTTLNIQAGSNGTITATIARTGSFAGTVTLSTENLPAGITASFNPSQITSATTSTTLTVAVGASVAAGTYNFTIRGTAAGLSTKTFQATVTVTAAPQGGGFTLSLNPSTLSIAQGQSSQTTVDVARTGGFAGAVTLALEGAPNGVTGTFSQNPVTNVSGNGDATTPATDSAATGTTTLSAAVGTATLTINVGGAVATGTHTLTIRATAQGQTARTATLTLTVSAPASYTLAASPSTVPVVQGQTGQSTINITRTNFAGNVTLAAEGLPNGVTAAFAQNPVSGNSTTVTFTVGAAVATGNHTITIRGTATGQADRTTTVTLNVTAAQVQSFTLAVNPTTVTVQQGASGQATATITRSGGFAGGVTLSATSGVPNGVTVGFSANPVTGNTATITFTVGASVTPGNHAINIRGTGTGVADQNQTVTLTVTQGQGGGGGNTTWEFCGAGNIPVWLAVQSGNGPWTFVAPGANNTWSFNITGNGGVAYVTQSGTTSYSLHITYGTQAELQSRGGIGCGDVTEPGTKTVTGTVAGLSGFADQAIISLGGATANASSQIPAFTLNNVRDGALDLVAARTTFDLGTGAFSTNKLIIQRGINPPNNSSLGTLDFNGAGAITPDTRTVTVANGLGDQIFAGTFFQTATSFASLGFGAPSTATTHNFAAVPDASQVATDTHMMTTMANETVGFDVVSLRTVTTIFKASANQSVTFGPKLPAGGVSVAGTAPYVRIRGQLTRQAEYNQLWSLTGSQTSGGVTRSVTITVSAAYLGGADLDIAVPDFSGVANWNNVWGQVPGAEIQTVLMASGWTGPGGVVQPNLVGTIIITAQRHGKLNP